MIRFTTEDGKPTCVAELGDRVGVYLDNDSLTELAKGDAALRGRFLTALHRRGTLLFSWTNAIEVSSATAVRSFLDAVGPQWIPLALSPWKVAEREKAGFGGRAPASESFVKSFFQSRAYDLSPEGSKMLDLSADTFFRLSAVIDWSLQNRDAILSQAADFDNVLREIVFRGRAAYETNRQLFDAFLPPIVFDGRYPATFALRHLLRILVFEAKAYQFKAHDGRDLCHAVLAAACAQVATLDKQWKRRVEKLPPPHQLAQVYYRRQIAGFVDRFETLVLERH